MRLTNEMITEDDKRFVRQDMMNELKYCGKEVPLRKSITNDDIRFYAWLCRSAYALLKEQENDPVLSAMENITSNYGDQGIFEIDERRYTTNEIMEHLENNTEIGHKFRTTINEMVITYLMKFKR